MAEKCRFIMVYIVLRLLGLAYCTYSFNDNFDCVDCSVSTQTRVFLQSCNCISIQWMAINLMLF